MYLGYQKNKIKFYTEQPLNQEIYNIDKVEETQDEYVLDGDEYVLKDSEYIAKELQKAKEAKYQEANSKANEYLQSGEALYEFEEGKHIEATDGNIAKMTAYALAFVTGQLQPTDTVVWNTKEDETVELNQEQTGIILAGLGEVQATVWAVKFPAYVQDIEQAQTVGEVNAIEIDYTMPEPDLVEQIEEEESTNG